MVFLLQTCSNSQDMGQEYVFIFFCMVFECCGFCGILVFGRLFYWAIF